MELSIGSNLMRNTSGILTVAGKDQIFLEEGDQGQLLLTVDLYDQTGEHVAKLRRNAWAFNKGDRFAVTTDPKALSLSDSQGAIVLRVRVVSHGHIELTEARFFTHKGHLMEITPDFWRIGGGVLMAGNVFDNCGGAVVID